MKTRRRDFLGWLGGTSLLAVTGPPLGPIAHVQTIDGHPAPVDEKFDMSWVDRVHGKFRAVFDSPEISEGAALFRAIAWCDQYKSVYGTARSDMTPVLVIRHEAIELAMDDAYWKRFEIGKEVKLKTPAGKKWAETNPIRTTAPGTPAQYARYNLGDFMQDGGIVLACNLAFGDVVARFQKEDKVDAATARQHAIDQLVPGVILQPSGVFAVLRAQEAGCRYIVAS